MSPQPPQGTSSTIKGKEWKWNQWDRIDINDPEKVQRGLTISTMGELIDWMEEEFGVSVDMVNAGVSLIYSGFLSKKIQDARRAMRVEQLVESISNKKIPANCRFLVLGLSLMNEDDEEVDIPYVRFRIIPPK